MVLLVPSVMKQFPVAFHCDEGMEEEVGVTATNYVKHKRSFSDVSGTESKDFSAQRPLLNSNPKPDCAQAARRTRCSTRSPSKCILSSSDSALRTQSSTQSPSQTSEDPGSLSE